MAQVGLLEDNTRIARLCATMLQYAGHQVTIYEHPQQCLDDLLVMPSAPATEDEVPASASSKGLDVLIIDLNLPDISGLEVIHTLHNHPQTSSLPLIFCTAASSSELQRALQIMPHAHFISKPFTYQELTSTVSSAVAAPTHS